VATTVTLSATGHCSTPFLWRRSDGWHRRLPTCSVADALGVWPTGALGLSERVLLGVGAVGSNPLPAPLGLATLSEMSHACSFFWISSTGDGESLREQPQRPASGRDRSEPSRWCSL